jgi:hypothetical protein
MPRPLCLTTIALLLASCAAPRANLAATAAPPQTVESACRLPGFGRVLHYHEKTQASAGADDTDNKFSFRFWLDVHCGHVTAGKVSGYVVTMRIKATNEVLGRSTIFVMPFLVPAQESDPLDHVVGGAAAQLSRTFGRADTAVPSASGFVGPVR